MPIFRLTCPECYLNLVLYVEIICDLTLDLSQSLNKDR